MAKHITQENFVTEVIESSVPVVIDFYAEWCGPCKLMAPHFEELAAELEGQYKLVKVNVDEEQQLAIQHRVASIPTLIVYKGGNVVKQQAGYLDKEQLKQFIAQNA